MLENFGLGGAFRTRALERWQDAPSAFVGPKALMDSMGTNAMKGFSSENYCAWFAAPGATLGAFLRAYIPVLLAHTRA
ncbi:MAG TPA: hypothetical protein VL856_02730 [Acidimicrobiia bacterium]|nr:hypothetical protein [Acidimicrobiia bacterium]